MPEMPATGNSSPAETSVSLISSDSRLFRPSFAIADFTNLLHGNWSSSLIDIDMVSVVIAAFMLFSPGLMTFPDVIGTVIGSSIRLRVESESISSVSGCVTDTDTDEGSCS